MATLDRINRRILDLLQRDGRMSLTGIAEEVGRSESAVRERLQRLEADGTIRGYQARLDPQRVGRPLRAIVQARVRSDSDADIAEGLARIPQVSSTSLVTGDRPILIELMCTDLEELTTVVGQRLTPLGLEDCDVRIVLSSLVEARGVDIATEPRPPSRPNVRLHGSEWRRGIAAVATH